MKSISGVKIWSTYFWKGGIAPLSGFSYYARKDLSKDMNQNEMLQVAKYLNVRFPTSFYEACFESALVTLEKSIPSGGCKPPHSVGSAKAVNL